MKKTCNIFIVLAAVACIAPRAADAACTGKDELHRDTVDGKLYGCNCNTKGEQHKVSSGFKTFANFPEMKYCYTGGNDKFKGLGAVYCNGFSAELYNATFKNDGTMEVQGDTTDKCWKWGCKAGHAFKADPKTGDVDYTTCILCSGEISGGVCMPPCDTASTITVKIKGVSKTVHANTRFGARCVPTCENQESSIDMTDATEFKISL